MGAAVCGGKRRGRRIRKLEEYQDGTKTGFETKIEIHEFEDGILRVFGMDGKGNILRLSEEALEVERRKVWPLPLHHSWIGGRVLRNAVLEHRTFWSGFQQSPSRAASLLGIHGRDHCSVCLQKAASLAVAGY